MCAHKTRFWLPPGVTVICARKSAWDKKPEISTTYTDSKARDVIAAGSSSCTDSEL